MRECEAQVLRMLESLNVKSQTSLGATLMQQRKHIDIEESSIFFSVFLQW